MGTTVSDTNSGLSPGSLPRQVDCSCVAFLFRGWGCPGVAPGSWADVADWRIVGTAQPANEKSRIENARIA